MDIRNREIVNLLHSKSLVLGSLAEESVMSTKDGRYMAGLACLFILAEQSVKTANSTVSGNFKDQVLELVDKKIITEAQGEILNDLRKRRNALFHESHYMWAVFDSNKNASLLSEDVAKQMIWNELSLPVLEICQELVCK